MTVTIRPMTLSDLAIANDIAVAAYQTPSRRTAEIRRYLGVQPDGWFLAIAGDMPVGMGGVVNYGTCAYIGMIGVLPTMQRRGIGRAIMAHIMEWLAAHGTPLAFLDASPAGAPLYEQLGFIVADQSEVWQLNNLPASIVQQVGITPLPTDAIPELIRFDSQYFYADRGVVLQALQREFPQRTLTITDDAGHITGYLVAQPRTLGPWVADTPEYAEVLLRHALTLPFDTAPTVLVPAANVAARELLRQMGFVKQRALQHMRKGGSQPRPRLGIYGLASFALG